MLVFSTNNTLIGNTVSNNLDSGIFICENSKNTTLSGNTVTHNNYSGITISSGSSDNTLSNNYVAENGEHGICLDSTNRNSIYGNNITSNLNFGIELSGSSYNSLYDNILSYNEDPVYLSDSSHNSLFGNTVTNNAGGITVSGSYNILFENTAANNYVGITLDGAHNTLYGNIITNNSVNGIGLGGFNNSLYDNHITNNEQGIAIWYASNNILFHNSFTDNTEHVHIYTSGYANVWDNGYPSGGNYWSDYTTKYPDAQELNHSGIWDTPYVIDADNRDRYPLMNPWTPTPDFLVTASPTSLTIQQGNSDTSVITVISLDEFNQPVQLTLSGAPSSVTTALNPEQVTPPPDATTTSTLTVSVGTTATLGSYTLTVTGTSGTLTHSVDILLEITLPSLKNQPPVADAGQDQSVSSGHLVLFNGSSSYDPDGTIGSYQWDFGDGAEEKGKIVNHRFRGAQNEAKTYTVTLTVEDDKGAIDTDTIHVTVYPLEKTLEVSHQPAVGEPAFARMTVTYNWINDDHYVVSKVHYESGGFVGFGDISIWDMHSHSVPTPLWAAAIPSFWNQKIYYPKLHTVLYGGDTFEGISVEALDAMNIYIIGWAGISISTDPYSPLFKTFFFKMASVCFQPDSTEVPDILTEVPDLFSAYLGSPAELRVYDSEARVTGLVNGEIKEEIPDSAYFNNTVVILSSSSSYRYEVRGTEAGSYGLIVASIIHGKNDTFTATDIPISNNAIHQYTIDWVAFSQGGEGATVQIDSDGNGAFEQTITANDELTRDEFLLQVPFEEAFPIWVVGVTITVTAIAAVALGFLWRKRKHSLTKG